MAVKTWDELMQAAEALRRAAWSEDQPAAFRIAVDVLGQFLAGMSYGALVGTEDKAAYQDRLAKWLAIRPLINAQHQDLDLAIEMHRGMVDRLERMKLEREITA